MFRFSARQSVRSGLAVRTPIDSRLLLVARGPHRPERFPWVWSRLDASDGRPSFCGSAAIRLTGARLLGDIVRRTRERKRGERERERERERESLEKGVRDAVARILLHLRVAPHAAPPLDVKSIQGEALCRRLL
jgi:hypothetical protein